MRSSRRTGQVRTNFLRSRSLLLVIVILVCTALLVFVRSTAFGTYIQESFMFAVDPSAQRSFEYGELHFNSVDHAEYDVDRAEYFFKKTAAIDPMYPYVYHELARIDFLKGKFRQAIAKIDFQIAMHGDTAPNSYYIRGLIKGYMGDYTGSAYDYAHYLKFDPLNWAAMNDYAWVLLKSGRTREAADVSATGLAHFPDNPWLLNTNAIALYELGDIVLAHAAARHALFEVRDVTLAEWLKAYPGNDPTAGLVGIDALQRSVMRNMHTITLAFASSTVQ